MHTHLLEIGGLINRIEVDLSFSLLQGQALNEYLVKLDKFAEVITWRKDHKLVGFVAFYCNDPHRNYAFITMLVVEQPSARQGIGSALISAVTSFVRQQRFEKILLHVNPTNSSALHFYERHGFRSVGSNEHSVAMELVL